MIQLKVNEAEQSFSGDPEMPLLWYLRDVLGLTGSKFGCGIGLCGACTVHVNGQATRSCVTAMQATSGKNITTVEGLEQIACGAEGLDAGQRAAMWLLSGGTNHAGRGFIESQKESNRQGNRGSHDREYLPVRNLSADSNRD